MKSLIIAFSTYSKIPMPRVDWDEKSMRYTMCYFPLVGGVLSAGTMLLLFLGTRVIPCSTFLLAGLLTILPFLVTGGIHFDGFLDTMDAKHSYKPKEEKLMILKDPHAGAFAIICGIVYYIAYLSFAYEAVCQYETDARWLFVFSLGHLLSRILSGISVVSFPRAKKDGMLATTANASENFVKYVLIIEGIVVAFAMLLLVPLAGVTALLSAGVVFLYYRLMSEKVFGGTTGDLAGYFLTICELAMLIALVLMQKLTMI